MAEKEVKQNINICEDKSLIALLECRWPYVKAEFSEGKLVLQGKVKSVENVKSCFIKLDIDSYRRQFIVSEEYPLKYLNENLNELVCRFVKSKDFLFLFIPHNKKKDFLEKMRLLVEELIVVQEYDNSDKTIGSVVDGLLFEHFGKIIVVGQSAVFTKDVEEMVRRAIRNKNDGASDNKRMSTFYDFTIDVEFCTRFQQAYFPKVNVTRMKNGFKLSWNSSEYPNEPITIIDLDIDRRKEQLILTEEKTREILNEKLQREGLVCILAVHVSKIYGIIPANCQGLEKLTQKICDVIDSSIYVKNRDYNDDNNDLLSKFIGKCTSLVQDQDSFLVFTEDVKEDLENILESKKKSIGMSDISANAKKSSCFDQKSKKKHSDIRTLQNGEGEESTDLEESSLDSFQNDFKMTWDSLSESEKYCHDDTVTKPAQQTLTKDKTDKLSNIKMVPCTIGTDRIRKKENKLEASDSSSNNEFDSSYEHVNNFELDSDLAHYIFNNKKFKVCESAKHLGCTIENDNGKIFIDGQNQKKLTTKIKSVVDKGCMYSTYIEKEKLKQCKTNLFEDSMGIKKVEGTLVTIHPCCSIRLVHSIMYKGVKVSLIHGSSADIPQSDVLLCPLDTKLNPRCASARHILSKGGATLREECLQTAINLNDQEKIFQNFDVVNLKKIDDPKKELQVKNVLGIVLQDSFSDMEQFQLEMKKKLKSIFHEMVPQNCISYSFPLEVGSKVPATIMARVCCCAIKELLCENIKEIFLCVVNENDLEGLTALISTELETDKKIQEKQKMNREQKPIKTVLYDQKLIQVRLFPGSLIDQQVDAIVVPVNSMLNLANGAISNQVLKRAGQTVQDELKKKHPQGIGPMEVRFTVPGYLNLKYILYSNLPELKSRYGPPAERVHILMQHLFQLVRELKIKSLAVPALGTGALKYPDDIVAMEMTRAIYMFASQSGIEEVRVVVYIKDSPQYKLFEKAVTEYEETVKRSSKAWLISPLFVEIDHKETRHPIKIICNGEENGMCDVEILLRKPTYVNKQDKIYSEVITVKEVPRMTTGLTRTRIFLDISDPRIDDQQVNEYYEFVLKLAVKDFAANFLLINLGKCDPASEAPVQIRKFLKKMTNVDRWKALQIRFLVSEDGLKECIQSAKDQNKGKLGPNFSFFLKSSEFKWQVAETTVGAEGAYMVICSENEERLQKALSEINHLLYMDENEVQGTAKLNVIDNTGLTNVNGSETKQSKGILQNGSPDTANDNGGEYVLLKDVQNEKTKATERSQKSDKSETNDFTPYENFKGTLPLYKLQHLPTKKLNDLKDSLSHISHCQFDKGGITFTIPYKQRHLLAKVLDEHLNNLDKEVYFVRNVSPSTFHLMELLFQLNSSDWKYHELDQELEIRKFEDVYHEAEERKTQFDSFQMDSIDVSKKRDLVNDTLQDFIAKKDPKFQNILLEAVNENMVINIHYPVDEHNIASEVKNMLQVKLQLIKQTGRKRRKFGDYSSLQPNFTTGSIENSSQFSVQKYPKDKLVECENTRIENKAQQSKESLLKRTNLPLDSTYMSLPVSRKSLNFTSNPVRKADKAVQDRVYRTGKDMKVIVYVGDITNLKVDCIVNAANESLMHGGGVAAVIARAAGRELQSESKRYIDNNGPLDVGECICTGAGRLPYKYVLHAVGPQWDMYQDKDDCAEELRKTIVNILRRTKDLKLKSVAIPSISSGIFGVPWDVCAQQYARGVTSFEDESNGTVEEVHFVDINENILKEIRDVFNTEFIPIENIGNN